MSANMALVQQAPPQVPATTAQSLEAIKSNFGIVQKAMESVLIKDVHYGVIPGTNNTKPTLLKPGADVLCSLFHLSPVYDYQGSDMGNGHREYMVTCTLSDLTGRVLGQGVGLATTLEPKYRYRKGSIACPKCGKQTVQQSKQEYGGGWYCAAKKGGCGAKFKADDPAIKGQNVPERTEHPDPAEYYNTCLKMAAKRAQVSAVLTVTGASAVLTQDLEDFQDKVIDAQYEAEGQPLEADDFAPQPTLGDILTELAEKAGLTSPDEKSALAEFVTNSAQARQPAVDPATIALSGLQYFDSFKKAFTAWLKPKPADKKADSKPATPAPSTPDTTPDTTPDISRATLDLVEKELTRLGVPNHLPPELAEQFETGDPSELTEAQGNKALRCLKAIKE